MFFSKKNDDKKTEQEKVDQRREEVLARGRKFKYPLQYTKYRIVVNTILIAFIAIVILFFGGWLALYKFQSTNDVLYRVTRVLPVSVAEVDGEKVLFSDYLMLYKSSITAVEQQSGQLKDDTESQMIRNQYKRMALTSAEKYTYALKIARELKITVSDEEIQNEFLRHQKVGGIDRSEEGFLKIVEDNFGLSKDEYKRMLYLTLTKAKVEENINTDANNITNEIQFMIDEGGTYLEIAQQFAENVVYEETGGLVDMKNIDGGRAEKAATLADGEDSGRFISSNGDSYYFVRLINKTDEQVNYVSIQVPFTEFGKRFENISAEEGKIKEYISIQE